ncbi:hypothetical protein NEOC84_000546|nr:hypothetical protein [Neochlamydia sp. AcF84]
MARKSAERSLFNKELLRELTLTSSCNEHVKRLKLMCLCLIPIPLLFDKILLPFNLSILPWLTPVL